MGLRNLGNQPSHAMLINTLKVITIFCEIDDFVHQCELFAQRQWLDNVKKQTVRKPTISASEMMTIELLYHLSGYKCFEYYYHNEVEQGSLQTYFPNAPSYRGFVQLKPRIVSLMILYLHCCRLGTMCGVYYADSTTIAVCNNRRIHNHRVFKGNAARGKSSTGWFFGFKLSLVVNAFGEIVRVAFTAGNEADNNAKRMLTLLLKLKGWVFADKGFINQKAFEQLFKNGLQLITGVRQNMKNKLMDMTQKLLLKKRGMIESVNDILKSICDIEHTRHRSYLNAILNIFAGICAYSFLDRLPSIFK